MLQIRGGGGDIKRLLQIPPQNFMHEYKAMAMKQECEGACNG